MKQEKAVDIALDGATIDLVPVLKLGTALDKNEIAEVVQSFLRKLESQDIGWLAKAAVRTVHGLITKWRKSWKNDDIP